MNKDRREVLIAVLGGSATASLLQRSQSVGTTLPETVVIDAVLGDLAATRSTSKGADVTLVVFTDNQCPACRLANRTMDSALADDPLVGVVYKGRAIFGLAKDAFDAFPLGRREALSGYIEGYYNRQRMHSALGHLAPEQAEQSMTG